MKTHILMLSAATLCGVADGYQSFGYSEDGHSIFTELRKSKVA
jgi:hypothetical protein